MKFTCTLTLLVAAFALASAAPQPDFGTWWNNAASDFNKFVQNGWERNNEAFKKLGEILTNQGKQDVKQEEEQVQEDVDGIEKQIEEDVKVIWDQGIYSVEEAGSDAKQIIGDVASDIIKGVEHPEDIKEEYKEEIEQIQEQIKEDTKVIMAQGKQSREEGDEDVKQIEEDVEKDIAQIEEQIENDIQQEADNVPQDALKASE